MFLRRMVYLVSMEAGMVCQTCNKLHEYDGTNSSLALRWERNVREYVRENIGNYIKKTYTNLSSTLMVLSVPGSISVSRGVFTSDAAISRSAIRTTCLPCPNPCTVTYSKES